MNILPNWLVFTLRLVSLLFLLLGFIFVYLAIRRKNYKIEEQRKTIKNLLREKANEFHSELIILERQLWFAQSKIPENEEAQDNVEVKKILDDIIIAKNKLGDLFTHPKQLDEYLDVLMQLYSHILEFHINPHEQEGIMLSNVSHANIRTFINNEFK
jgi:hypothetical protein